MRIKTVGHQAFNVPNDEEGRKFLEKMRCYLNKGWTYRARGRGPRSAPEGVFDPHFGSPHSISQANSEWIAVYLHEQRAAGIETVVEMMTDHWADNFQKPAPETPDDTTELTPEESELLEDIIKMAAGGPLFNPDQDLMDSLVNKLID